MKKKGLWLGVLLLLLLVLPASTVFADGPRIVTDDGRIFVDKDVSLEPGETMDGDLGVFNGDLSVPAGSAINGDVFVTNGEVEVSGTIAGSLAVIGGDLTLAQGAVVEGDLFVMSGDSEIAGRVRGDLSIWSGRGDLRDTAVVEGDLMSVSGSLERAAGARVGGEELSDIRLPDLAIIRERIDVLQMPGRFVNLPWVPRYAGETPGQQFSRFLGRVMTAGFFGLVFIALGVLIVLIWPRPTRRVSECVATMPVQSFVLGLLTFLIAAVLEALAAVLLILLIVLGAGLIGTVILSPIGLLLILLSVLVLLPVPLTLLVGMVLGWVALAELIGQKVGKALRARNLQPLGATLLGLLITVPVTAILWVIEPCCCAWPFVVLLTSIGLGAVFHTRFGKQDCRQPTPPSRPQEKAGKPETLPAELDEKAGELEALPAEAMDEEAGAPDQPSDVTT